MPPSPSGSFIPKRNTGSRPHGVRRYNFFILPIISYTLFIAAPLASAALFIYQIRVESQFKAAVANLEEQIQVFNDADLTRVIEFDDRLTLANELVDSHVSLVSLLAILENATADTVQFKNLSITRKDDKTLLAKGSLTTSALDGALFQRSTYSAATQISEAKLNGVTLLTGGASEAKTDGKTETVSAAKGSVLLNAEFTFAADKILYAPLGVPAGSDSSVQTELVNPAAAAESTDASSSVPAANVITP
jgi:hypothetical protein